MNKAKWCQVAVILVLCCWSRRTTGHAVPVAAVISGSMEPQLWRGDLVFFINNTASEPLRVGEVVLFRMPKCDKLFVHRVDDLIGNERIVTKGDNNPVNDLTLYRQCQTDRWKQWLTGDQIVGRVRGQLPWIGYPSLWLQELHWVLRLALVCATLFGVVKS